METQSLCPAADCPSGSHPARARPCPAGTGPRLCAACRDRLRRDLLGLPRLYEDCGERLAPSRPAVAERISGGRSRQGIRLDEAALRARDDMLRVLASWAGAVAAEHGPAGPDRREVHALAAFLVRRLDHLVAHPAAGECAGEVRRVTDAARSAVRPRPVVRRELGPCPVAGCGEPVRAEADADAPVTAHTVRCGAGHSVPPHQWLLLDRRAA